MTLPALTTLSFPDTGAARSVTPFWERLSPAAAAKRGERPCDLRPGLRQRLGLLAGAVPDGDAPPRLRQPLRHRIAHAPDADPAQTVRPHVCRCHHSISVIDIAAAIA